MKKVKLLALLLALAMLFTVLAACGNNGDSGSTTTTTTTAAADDGDTTEPADDDDDDDADDGDDADYLSNINLDDQFPVVHEPITLTLMGSRAANQGDWEDMKFFTVLQERSNINLEFITVPSESWEERKNLAFAGDNLPDIFFGVHMTASDELRYGPQGYLRPLNDLVDNYSVNLKGLLDNQPTVRQDITTPDGNIYTLPYVNDMPRDLTDKLWFNKAWVDALDLEVPTTVDELYDVLKAFKEGDPNGSGTDDEIPISFKDLDNPNDLKLMLSYWGLTVDRATYIANLDDILAFAPMHDNYKDFLKFFTRLYDENLLDSESFTQKNEQLRAKGKEEPQLLGAFVQAGAFLVVPDDQNEDYIALPPMKTADGSQEWIKLNPVNPGAFAITKEADDEQAVAAMRMVDWVYGTEGALVLMRGIEDEDYIYTNEERTECIVVHPEDRYSNFQEYRAAELTPNAGSRTPGIGGYTLPVVYNALNDYINVQVDENLWPHLKQPLPLLYFSDDEQRDIASIGADVNSYVVQTMAQFITGELDVDSDWDSYVADLERMGIERYMELHQNAYDVWKSNS